MRKTGGNIASSNTGKPALYFDLPFYTTDCATSLHPQMAGPKGVIGDYNESKRNLSKLKMMEEMRSQREIMHMAGAAQAVNVDSLTLKAAKDLAKEKEKVAFINNPALCF
jgi:hypothetical protein